MERNQFTFYASFFKAVTLIPRATERCRVFEAICRYGLYGEEPNHERLGNSGVMAWQLIRPILESGRRKADSGRKGGESNRQAGEPKKPEQRPSNGQANPEQPESKNKDKNKIKIKDKCPTGGEGEDEGEDEVVNYLLHRVDICPSHRCREELRGFVSRVGAEVCLRAIDEAADAGKPSWAYIRGILRAKEGLGVRSLADWDRLEAQRRSAGGRAVPPSRLGTVPGVVSTGPDRQAVEDMERDRKSVV